MDIGGQEVKIRDEPEIKIQEKGEILFFYRPKVEREVAHSSEDVQRLYIILRPVEIEDENKQKISHKSSSTSDDGAASPKKRKIHETKNVDIAHEEKTSIRQQEASAESGKTDAQEVDIEKQTLMRLMVMGKKGLPDPHKKSRRPYWGFVEMVTPNVDDLKEALKGEEYDTSTRGHRHTSTARAFGEGIYRILKHINPGGKNKKSHTHLIYKLRFPPPTHDEHEKENEKYEKEDEKSPQESLHIDCEASFLIQIKNPAAGGGASGFRGLQGKKRAEFPAGLQEKFGKLRFCPCDPTYFLNYEGCEFLLIAASDDVSEELGLELETKEYETTESASCSDLLNIFGENDISAPSSPIASLLKGIWA